MISNHKLQKRIAEEGQLLAEEKWIIKALSLVKRERNSLQIERLQLESLKLHAQGLVPRSSASIADEEPSTSVVNLMQNANTFNSCDRLDFEKEASQASAVACNEEKLNLTVTKSVFEQMNDDIAMEEDEDDDENFDVLIDMNMLMNGQM